MQRLINILKFIILGIIQGCSEILPISSSGHLLLLQSFMHINQNQIAIVTILLHFSSLLALVIYFRKLIIKIFVGSFRYIFLKDKTRKEDFDYLIFLIIASIPIGIVGIFLEDKIDSLFSNLLFVGIGFIFTAFILLLYRKLENKNNESLSIKQALMAGLFQLIGIFPGISRSGMTLTGNKLAGLENKKAKEFTFLLFIPVAFGSFIFSLDDACLLFKASIDLLICSIISMVVTFIFTYLAIHLFLNKLNNKHFKYFSIYLVSIGIFTILYAIL